MGWVPSSAWLTKVAIDGTAGQLGYRPRDRRVGSGPAVGGRAGFTMPGAVIPPTPVDVSRMLLALALASLGAAGIGLIMRARPTARPPGRLVTRR